MTKRDLMIVVGCSLFWIYSRSGARVVFCFSFAKQLQSTSALPTINSKLRKLVFLSHRFLSGRQGPASVLAGVRVSGGSCWFHAGRDKVALSLRDPAGVCCGPPLPAR